MKCTYCGGTDFYEGPAGGLSVNILCANADCRHWFNTNSLDGRMEDLHRVEPSKEEAKSKEDKWREDFRKATELSFIEGEEAFENGLDPQTLRKDPGYGGYAEATSNINRLVGYLRGMNKAIQNMK